MNRPARGQHVLHAALALTAAALLLAGCKSEKTAATGNSLEMRNMDVVDGTVNDSMTDLDAASADGLGAPASAQNSETAAKE